jgi:hypothetical protein
MGNMMNMNDKEEKMEMEEVTGKNIEKRETERSIFCTHIFPS